MDIKQFFFNNRLKALLWMLLGSLMVFTLIVVMNRFADSPKKSDVKKTASFDVKEAPKKKPKQKPKPKPKPKKQKSTPKASAPQISSSLSGTSFGIPDFSSDFDIGEDMLGDVKDVVMTDDSVDVAPKPVQRASLEYPKRARAKGIEGYVTMNLLVSSRGDVENVKVLESQPEGVFDDAATGSVRSWKFEPAKYKSQAVKVWAQQTIRFKLD